MRTWPRIVAVRERAWPVIRSLLGVLLVAAAGLKLAGQGVSAVPQIGWFAMPTVQIAAAEWEIVLGLWLLSGRFQPGAWLAALATFLAFAGVSGYLGWIGVARCGCFGTIEASPWHACGVDGVSITLLALFRPDLASVRYVNRVEMRRSSRIMLASGLGIAGMVIVVVGAATVTFGSPHAALARFRGETVTISESYVDFGIGEPGQTLEATIEVRNWTDHPVRLIGGTSDCSCVTTTSLPETIPARGSRKIPIQLRLKPSAPGSFTVRRNCGRTMTTNVLCNCTLVAESDNRELLLVAVRIPNRGTESMKRCCMFSTWGFGCLAVTLLILATLAVPSSSVLADSGGGAGPLVCGPSCNCMVLPCLDDVCSSGVDACDTCTCVRRSAVVASADRQIVLRSTCRKLGEGRYRQVRHLPSPYLNASIGCRETPDSEIFRQLRSNII